MSLSSKDIGLEAELKDLQSSRTNLAPVGAEQKEEGLEHLSQIEDLTEKDNKDNKESDNLPEG